MDDDDGEIVGDEDEPHAVLVDEAAQQFEDAGLGGDVEGGGRLVGDQQLWAHGDGRGDDDALALAARQLVRIAVAREEVGGQAGAGQGPVGLGEGLAAAKVVRAPAGFPQPARR